MSKYRTLSNIKYDSDIVPAGKVVELTDDEAKGLLEAGAVEVIDGHAQVDEAPEDTPATDPAAPEAPATPDPLVPSGTSPVAPVQESTPPKQPTAEEIEQTLKSVNSSDEPKAS